MLQHGRMTTQPTIVAGGQPRTSWATINGLPPEIFYEIILLAALQDQIEGYYDRLRFLRLVATSWSALINNHPKFWTTVSSSDCEPAWQMALQRSKAAEIDVDAGSLRRPEPPQTRLIKAIVGHMLRVRSLGILDRDFEYLIANAPAAPRLRSLYLGRGFDRDDSIALLGFHPAKWAPNLRDVDLMCSRLIWKEPLWGNLERLRINTGFFVQGLPMQEIFTILEASPGLRSLDIAGIMPHEQSPLPVVKLEVLEYLRFSTTTGGSLVEALNSINALPTARCTIILDVSDETQVESILQSICKIGSGVVDGEAGRKLELVVGGYPSDPSRITMGGFEVWLYDYTRGLLNYRTTFTQIFEGLLPSRCEAVTTVEITDTDFGNFKVPAAIVHSFFPNVSHLTVPRITKALEKALGRPNEEWLMPHLETISLSRHNNRRRPRLMGVVKARLKAAQVGEHVTQIKNLSLKFNCWSHTDQDEIAELDALVPNVAVEYPEVSRSDIFDNYSKGKGLK